MEKIFKGISNHKRLDILFLINNEEGITVDSIANRLNFDFKNTSAHLQKLVNAGLINKKYVGKQVSHKLSPYGKKFIRFIKTF